MTLDHDDIARRLKDAVAHVQPTLTGADLERRLGRTGPVVRRRSTPTTTTRPRAIAYAVAAALVLVAGLGAAFATRTRPGSVGDTSTSATTAPPPSSSSTTAEPGTGWVGVTRGGTAGVPFPAAPAVASSVAAAAGEVTPAPPGRDPGAVAPAAVPDTVGAPTSVGASGGPTVATSPPISTPSARPTTTTAADATTVASGTTAPAPATTAPPPAPATTAPATTAPATTAPPATVAPTPSFVPNAAGDVRSVYSIPTYAATVSSTTYAGTALVVTFSASGPIDLVRPEGTCVTVTGPGGGTVVFRPSAVSLVTDTPGAFAGTLTFAVPTPGTVDLQYGCFAGYSQARLGTLLPPATTYQSADGQQSTYTPNTAYRATFATSSVTGGNLIVVFSASGPTDLVRPEGTCLTITAATGTTRVLTPSTVLTTNTAGSYAGTFTYTGVSTGTFDLQYGCLTGYTQARIGVLS